MMDSMSTWVMIGAPRAVPGAGRPEVCDDCGRRVWLSRREAAQLDAWEDAGKCLAVFCLHHALYRWGGRIVSDVLLAQHALEYAG